jgi:Helix-turn-helix domain
MPLIMLNGMPSIGLAPLSGRYLSFREREEIAIWKAQGAGVREISRRLGRAPSTTSRELRRNSTTRGGRLDYRASVAQWKADLVAQWPKTARLVASQRLREYVQERLSGQVRRPDGTPVAGPAAAPWKGRNTHFPRADGPLRLSRRGHAAGVAGRLADGWFPQVPPGPKLDDARARF